MRRPSPMKTVPKIDAGSQQHRNYVPSMLDRPRMERAIAELVRVAARVGVSDGDLLQMIGSGVTVSEILKILEEKSCGRVQ
jgi:fructose-1,6-bisphosphatase/sedoheptulose 1,7-bisphosphatase-like protein